MSLQVILRIAGIAALVISGLFVILAIHYYVTNHIGAVMDDLSGKARARGVADLGGGRAASERRSSQTRRRSERRTSAPAPAVTKGTVEAAPEAVGAFAAFAEAPAAAPILDDEDDMDTVVVDVDFGAEAGAAAPVTVATEPTAEQEPSAGTFVFRVTRSIVLCDSDQIIASREGM